MDTINMQTSKSEIIVKQEKKSSALLNPLTTVPIVKECITHEQRFPQVTTSAEVPSKKDQHFRMGGAARKRFKRLLASSVPVEETRLLALNPKSQITVKESETAELCKETNPPKHSFDSASSVEAPSKFFKMNGASRKRLRRLMAANIEYEEACALAIKSLSKTQFTNLPPDPKAKKRPCIEEEPEQNFKMPKIDEPAAARTLCLNQVVGITRVKITNVSPMTEAQLDLVHRCLIVAMLEISCSRKGPKFAGFLHKPGWIQVTCEDKESLKWLCMEVYKLKPWKGASLSVLSENDLPVQLSPTGTADSSETLGTTFIPSSEVQSVDEAIKLLWIQNEGLNTQI